MGRLRGLAVFFLLLGCEADDDPVDEGPSSCAGAKCDDAADDAAPYELALGDDYTFCMDLAEADDGDKAAYHNAFVDMPLPNLGNVQFLVHAADMAYWEGPQLGPELERLGFGARGEGDVMADCARDVTIVRDSSTSDPFADEDLSDCALDWLEGGGTDPADFVRYAESEVHPERSIEFFSEGYEVEEGGEYVRGSTQVVWAEHRTEPLVIVSFRGTELPDLNDVWADANFPTVPFAFGRVHGGFHDALSSVRPLLERRLAGLESGTRIWVTGHSLGGALASVFSGELLARIDGGEPMAFEGMVTYGSPRVGNDAFFAGAEKIAIEHGVALHRVSNVSRSIVGYDPIVHLPFRETFDEDFGHVGAPLEFFEGGLIEYALEPSRAVLPFGFIEEAIDRFKEAVLNELSRAFPHFLSQYKMRIDAAIASEYYEALRRCDPG